MRLLNIDMEREFLFTDLLALERSYENEQNLKKEKEFQLKTKIKYGKTRKIYPGRVKCYSLSKTGGLKF